MLGTEGGEEEVKTIDFFKTQYMVGQGLNKFNQIEND